MRTPRNLNGIVDRVGRRIQDFWSHHRNSHGFDIRQIHITIVSSLKSHLIGLITNLLAKRFPRENVRAGIKSCRMSDIGQWPTKGLHRDVVTIGIRSNDLKPDIITGSNTLVIDG